MSLASRISSRISTVLVTALAVLCMSPLAEARNFSHSPSISGNWGVALVIVIGAIALLVVLVRGVLFLERRDAWLGRGAKDRNDSWFSD